METGGRRRIETKKKYSMKKTKIIDYYEAKLKSEPQHEKYTPTNFAAFLLEGAQLRDGNARNDAGCLRYGCPFEKGTGGCV